MSKTTDRVIDEMNRRRLAGTQDHDPRGITWSRCPATLGRRHAFWYDMAGEGRCYYCARTKSDLEHELDVALGRSR